MRNVNPHPNDAKISVLSVIYTQDKDPHAMIDLAVYLTANGKPIGESKDHRRTYYVMDGRVFVVWPDVDISSMDYFDFCSTLREPVPRGRVLDFVPFPPFHLGWPPENVPDPNDGQEPCPRPMSFANAAGMPAGGPRPREAGEKQGGYELMYGGGGHGGPYPSLADATDAAERLVRPTCRLIWIIPRDNRRLDPANAVRIVKLDRDLEPRQVTVEDTPNAIGHRPLDPSRPEKGAF